MKKFNYLVLGLLFISQHIVAQVPSYVPTDGLVAYYPFNGNANDETGNGNNGTVDGAKLITDRFENSNSAYEFDGINNSITVSNQFFDNGSGSYAINLWFSCNDINQTMQNIYNTVPHNGEGLTFNHENSPENMTHWKNSNPSSGSSWDILSANPFEYSPFLNSTTYIYLYMYCTCIPVSVGRNFGISRYMCTCMYQQHDIVQQFCRKRGPTLLQCHRKKYLNDCSRVPITDASYSGVCSRGLVLR